MTKDNAQIDMHRKENNHVVYELDDRQMTVVSRGCEYKIVDGDGNIEANFIDSKREAKKMAKEILLSDEDDEEETEMTEDETGKHTVHQQNMYVDPETGKADWVDNHNVY